MNTRTRWLLIVLLCCWACAAEVHASACLPATPWDIAGTRLRYIVATGGSGTACDVNTPCTFAQAISTLTAGDTIILAPGTYQLNTFTQNGIFVGTRANVTIRGVDHLSCDTTIIDGNGMNNAPSGLNPSGAGTGVNYGINSAGANTVIAHLTIRGIFQHPIAFDPPASAPIMHQVRLQDGGQQHLKVNPAGVDGGILEDSIIEYTVAAPTGDHGGGEAYFNGISAHRADNWIIRRSLFANLHNPDTAPSNRWNNPGVLIWNCSDTWLIEQSTFINNDVSIAAGNLLNPACGTYDAANVTIRNNVIVQTTGFFSGARQTASDGQINAWYAANTKIYHNTILNHGNSTHAIQIRWLTTPGSDIQNNLADDTIHLRDSAAATSNGNYLTAVDAWFVDPQVGDVHLNDVAGTQANVINQAPTLGAVTNDFYGITRPQGAGYDRGAVEDTGAIFNFSLSLSTAAPIIGRGLSVQVTLTATASGAPAEVVNWSSSGAETGTTVGFGPNCTASCAVTVTIQTRTSTVLGLDTITLVGTSASREQTIPLALTVLQTVGPACTIFWNAVTENADETPITDLDHYNVYRRTSGAYGSPAVSVNAPAVQTSCSAAGLSTPGAHYLQITAVDTTAHESGASAEKGVWWSATAVAGSAGAIHHHREQ